jgi:hypothetical protein
MLADTRDGLSPESISPDLLAQATPVRDDSADTVTAHALAFAAAFHQHRNGEAAERLETCLAHSQRVPPVVREALMSEAALFQARSRKRPDLANNGWLLSRQTPGTGGFDPVPRPPFWSPKATSPLPWAS